MDTARKNNIKGMAAAFAGNSIFGFTFVFTKTIFNAGMSPYALLSWRLVIATLLMLLLSACGVLRLDFRGKPLWKLLPLALTEPCLYFIFESIGIARTTASESGTIIALIPIWVLILCRVIFKERHTRGQIIGVLLSVAGIICVVLSGGLSANFSAVGYLCLFGAVLIAGFYNMGIRVLVKEFSGAELTFGTNAVGLVFFAALTCGQGVISGDMAGIWLLPLHNMQVLIYILLLAAGASVGAYLLIIYGISHIGPARSSTFCAFSTLNSILFGLLLLGERMLPGQLIGAAMIIVGVWGANHFISLPQEEPLTPQAAEGQ